MGINLSCEVKNFLNSRSFLKEARISFIGFSMGGLIIRSALPRLKEY